VWFVNADHIPDDGLPRLGRALDELRRRQREARYAAGEALGWTEWWNAAAADPALAPLVAERNARFGGPDHGTDVTPPVSWHLDTLRTAGYIEVGLVWRGLTDSDRPFLVLAFLNLLLVALMSVTAVALPVAMSADGLLATAFGSVIALNGVLIVLGQFAVVRVIRDRRRDGCWRWRHCWWAWGWAYSPSVTDWCCTPSRCWCVGPASDRGAEIVQRRPDATGTALRLVRYCGTTERFWKGRARSRPSPVDLDTIRGGSLSSRQGEIDCTVFDRPP